ncbi:MAG: porin [Longimicrobiales bacterium]|nr:porin [Longimicrobiales bacterium]
MSSPTVLTTVRRLVSGFALVAFLAVAAPAGAQQSEEPILDRVQQLFSSEGMSLGFLLQAVVDPGIDDDPARVTVPNARLRLYGQLDNGFGYKLQTNHAGAATLLDAQVTWSPGPELSIAAGRFKTPFSREFLVYGGAIDFVNRSRVVSRLAPNRQMGVQLGGQLNEIVSWTAGGFTGANNATSDESLIGVVRLEGAGIEVGEGTLSVAANFAGGREDAIGARQLGPAFSGDGILYGADARFVSGPLMLAGEYIRGEWEPDFGVTEVESDGLYVTAGYMVQDDRQLLLRWDRFEAPGQDADDVLILGFNAWPTSATEIQVNWQIPLKDSNELHKLLLNFQVGI